MEKSTGSNGSLALYAGAFAASFFFLAFFAVSLSSTLAAAQAESIEQFRTLEMRNGLIFAGVCAAGLFVLCYSTLRWGRRHENRVAELDGQLQEASSRLAAATLVHTVIHDTNNLLGVVRSGLTMLKEPALAGNREALCDRMQTAVNRVEELHRQLLQRERKLHDEAATVSVFPVCDVFDELRSYARLHPRLRDCKLEFTGGQGLEIRANRTEFAQAVLNLVLNAADATGNRGHVHAEAKGVLGHAHISVDDDGPGVAPEDRDRIFGAFVTGKKNGMGLGLMSVKGFCQRYSGDVSIETSRWNGARFIIDMPLHAQETNPLTARLSPVAAT